jgi:hypothetical protein
LALILFFKHGSGRLMGIAIHPNPKHIAFKAQTWAINTVKSMLQHPNAQVLASTTSKYGISTNDIFPIVQSPKLNRKY